MSTPSVTILKNLVLNWKSNQMEEEVSLAGESHDMVSASEHQTESEMPEPALAAIL